MSLHLYPADWGKDADWGAQYIVNHTLAAQSLGKPVLLGEFGWQGSMAQVYQQWTSTALQAGTNGWLFWMTSGLQTNSSFYPDYDGFAMYCTNPGDPAPPGGDPAACGVLTAAAMQMAEQNDSGSESESTQAGA